jgi:hypothetical protein
MKIIGKQTGGPPLSDAELFFKCEACGGYFDMRDLGAVLDHEGPAEQDVGFGHHGAKRGLPLKQRRFGHIVSVQIKQIERVQHELGRFTPQLILQHREIRDAIGGGSDDLAVDNRRPHIEVPCISRDLLEAIGPVIAATGEHADGVVGNVHLHATS